MTVPYNNFQSTVTDAIPLNNHESSVTLTLHMGKPRPRNVLRVTKLVSSRVKIQDTDLLTPNPMFFQFHAVEDRACILFILLSIQNSAIFLLNRGILIYKVKTSFSSIFNLFIFHLLLSTPFISNLCIPAIACHCAQH